MLKQLDPMLDVVFKMFFTRPGSEELLHSLLTAVLHPPSPIDSVVILNPELDKDSVGDRGIILDLRLKLADGTLMNVEMQARRGTGAMRERELYHWARMYGSQLVRGDKFHALAACISVFLLGYDELPSGPFHSTFEVLERHTHERLTDHLQLHLVQLRHLPQPGSVERDEELPLVTWARFFASRDDTERRELAMSDPIFDQANAVLDELSADPVAQRFARDREEGQIWYQMDLEAARRSGIEQGIEQGLEKGREEGREVLRTLASQRFGELPPLAMELIASASTAQLTTWTGLLFDSPSAEAWLRSMAESA